MKKMYIRPIIDIIKVSTSPLLQASVTINNSGDAINAGNAASRGGGGFWDEEEE